MFLEIEKKNSGKNWHLKTKTKWFTEAEFQISNLQKANLKKPKKKKKKKKERKKKKKTHTHTHKTLLI